MSSVLTFSPSYKDVFNDALKAPLFNTLLLFTMLSIHLGKAVFYSSATLILFYFIVHFISNFKENRELLTQTVLTLKNTAVAFTLILLIMTISNITNDIGNVKAWIYEIKFFLKIPLFILVLLFFYKKQFFTIQLFYSFVLIGLVFQSLDGIFQAYNGYDFYRATQRTLCQGLTGTTTNRNFFGYIVGFGLFVFLQLTLDSKKTPMKIMSFLLGSLFFFCILYSLSRGVWVAALTSLGFLFLYSFFTKQYKRGLVILGVFSLLLISIFTPDCLATRSIAVLEGSSSARYPIWKEVLDMVMEKPTFGWGMEKMNLTGKFTSHAHNVLLEIVLYTGILGLLAFTFCILSVVKEMFLNKQIILFAIMLYVLVRCFFDHTLFSGHLIPTTMVILIFSTYAATIRRERDAGP